jgi:protein-disulfide isomerase
VAMLRTPITTRDHRRGDPDAPVTLVEYGDYQCPHCAMAQPIVRELLHSFDANLALVYRHFPLMEVHPLSSTAAQAAEFAGEHGAFWEMHEALFASQPQLSLPAILRIADALGVSQAGLRQALSAGTYADKVREDFTGGVRSGVNGTPCFFVNGLRHDGAYGFAELAAAIAAVLPAPPPPLHPITPTTSVREVDEPPQRRVP